MAFNVPFTTSQFPVSLNHDQDIATHDQVLGAGKLGIVCTNGTVLRFVDFSPGFESMMHRTRSLYYGIVIEGTIELILDSGESQLLQRGDVWTRVVYLLQDCQPVEVAGETLKEDLGRSRGEIPPSGNDQVKRWPRYMLVAQLVRSPLGPASCVLAFTSRGQAFQLDRPGNA